MAYFKMNAMWNYYRTQHTLSQKTSLVHFKHKPRHIYPPFSKNELATRIELSSFETRKIWIFKLVRDFIIFNSIQPNWFVVMIIQLILFAQWTFRVDSLLNVFITSLSYEIFIICSNWLTGLCFSSWQLSFTQIVWTDLIICTCKTCWFNSIRICVQTIR